MCHVIFVKCIIYCREHFPLFVEGVGKIEFNQRIDVAGAKLERCCVLIGGRAMYPELMGILGCRMANPSLQRLAVNTGEALDELEAAVYSRGHLNRGSARWWAANLN